MEKKNQKIEKEKWRRINQKQSYHKTQNKSKKLIKWFIMIKETSQSKMKNDYSEDNIKFDLLSKES